MKDPKQEFRKTQKEKWGNFKAGQTLTVAGLSLIAVGSGDETCKGCIFAQDWQLRRQREVSLLCGYGDCDVSAYHWRVVK